ncbi:MAG: porin [Deltaproteobacteria bacterium]|nr:porin [Deltaproteobacteria bacterium]
MKGKTVEMRFAGLVTITLGFLLLATHAVSAKELALDDIRKEYPVLQYLKGIQLSGFLTTFYSWNLNGASKGGPGTTAHRVNDFRYNDIEANQFVLDMAELQAVKLSTPESRVGFGVTADYGSTVRKLQSAGFGTKDPLGFTTNSFDLRQAYLTYKAPIGKGLDLKVGKFDSLVGLEVNAQAYNLNTSRGLLYWLTPGVHTGLLLSYPLFDWLSLTAGVVNGWDVADDNNDSKSITGSLSITPAKNLTILLGAVYGAEQGSWGIFTEADDDNVRWIGDLVVIYNPTDKLTINFTADMGEEKKNPFTINEAQPTAIDNQWYSVGAIVKYQLTSAFSAALRGEWVRDDDGAVLFKHFDVPPVDITDPTNPNFGSRTFADGGFRGFPQEIWEVTATAEYKFSDNFRTRLEYRHDQSNKDVFRGRVDNATFTMSGGEDSQDTISVEFTALF